MKYAHELGQARLSKDQSKIDIAQKKHDEYHDLCLASDEMALF